MDGSITKKDVETIVNKVLMEDFEVPEDKLLPDAAIFADLELDSLDIVDLIVALEKAFGIKIRTDDAAQTFRDVRTLADLHETIFKMRPDNDS